MANYLITKEAANDLRSIWNYTFDNWSESQADLYYNALIAEFGKISSDKSNLDKEYRQIEVGLFCRRCNRHLIFYKRNNDSSVLIIRVLHQMMDIESKF